MTFVGFGFGPIQAGLFLYEAHSTGAFDRMVIAEIVPEVIASVRAAQGRVGLNIAHADHIERLQLGPLEIENPAVAEDRERLIASIAAASEIATAVPSIQFYRGPGPESPHRVLAAGLTRRAGRPTIVYAAENHLAAAEELRDAVMEEVPTSERDAVREATCFVNTVIGKMSAVVTDAERLATTQLLPVTGEGARAFLVEAFRSIYISRLSPQTADLRRLQAFEEKDDLEPFEEAKLYGHNATHAVAGYLAARRGLTTMNQLREHPDLLAVARGAFLEESGAALCTKWRGVDPLFTPAGFQEYVDDLMTRMTNPHLGDLVARVIRDPARKLGWNDRLVGAARLALKEGCAPERLCRGAAAALAHWAPEAVGIPEVAKRKLEDLWAPSLPDPTVATDLSSRIVSALAAI